MTIADYIHLGTAALIAFGLGAVSWRGGLAKLFAGLLGLAMVANIWLFAVDYSKAAAPKGEIHQ